MPERTNWTERRLLSLAVDTLERRANEVPVLDYESRLGIRALGLGQPLEQHLLHVIFCGD